MGWFRCILWNLHTFEVSTTRAFLGFVFRTYSFRVSRPSLDDSGSFSGLF